MPSSFLTCPKVEGLLTHKKNKSRPFHPKDLWEKFGRLW